MHKHPRILAPLLLALLTACALPEVGAAEFLLSEQDQMMLYRWVPGSAPVPYHNVRCNDGDYNVTEGSTDGWIVEHWTDHIGPFVPGSGSGITFMWMTPYAFPKHVTVFGGEVIVMSSNDATIHRYTQAGGASIASYPTGQSIGMGTVTDGTDLFACLWTGTTTTIFRYDDTFAQIGTIALPSGIAGRNCFFDLAYDRGTGRYFALADAGYGVISDTVLEFDMGGAVVNSYTLPFQADGIGQFEPGLRLLQVDTAPTTVSPGQTGIAVTVDAMNASPTESITVTAVGLDFTGTVDRTSDYAVTPAPGNPTAIAPGATERFDFSVDVLPTAAAETILIDAHMDGTTSPGLIAVSAGGADTTDTWDVLPCLAPLCGDCSGDTMVTIIDALLAAQHAAGLITLTGTAFSNCNVLGTLEPDPAASVDVLDALTIAQFAAGLPVVLTCC